MIRWRYTARKGLTVFLALVVAALILRPQLSSALTTRGDDLRYQGNTVRALAMYQRALAMDPDNRVAADRFVFTAMTSHVHRLEALGLTVANRVLIRDPKDDVVRYDRALCAQKLRDFDLASRDFELVGRDARDPRALTFAALDLRRTRPERARMLLALALAIDSRFEPARRDLARIATWKK